MVRFYNYLSRKVEEFESIGKTVGLYTCGPTVYDYAHIGHARTYVFADLLKRTLEFNEYKVKHVMNITDVGHLTSDSDTGEDKMEKGAAREKKTVWEIAKFYTNDFFKMLVALNIEKPEIFPKATDHVSLMIDLIKTLEKRGYTYEIKYDGIYFDTSKFGSYGQLLGLTFPELQKGLKAGARVPVVAGKKHLTDFVLWKFSSSVEQAAYGRRQMEWWFSGPFKGKLYKKEDWLKLDKMAEEGRITDQERKEARTTIGFPGWHIECSAMGMKYLGDHFDIHSGGIDHVPIHHTNEIAQSEAATGKKFVNYWMEGEHLLVEGQKMSKSLGNIYRVEDLIKKGFDPLALRYLFLTAHYRSKLNFTWESLGSAQSALDNLRQQIGEWEDPKVGCVEFEGNFKEAINNDLDMPKALSVMWEMVRSNYPDSAKHQSILVMDKVFGLGLDQIKHQELPKGAKELIDRREELRSKGNFKESDKIRKELERMGVFVEDTQTGPQWKIQR